jgi:hypothetical protein
MESKVETLAIETKGDDDSDDSDDELCEKLSLKDMYKNVFLPEDISDIKLSDMKDLVSMNIVKLILNVNIMKASLIQFKKELGERVKVVFNTILNNYKVYLKAINRLSEEEKEKKLKDLINIDFKRSPKGRQEYCNTVRDQKAYAKQLLVSYLYEISEIPYKQQKASVDMEKKPRLLKIVAMAMKIGLNYQMLAPFKYNEKKLLNITDVDLDVMFKGTVITEDMEDENKDKLKKVKMSEQGPYWDGLNVGEYTTLHALKMLDKVQREEMMKDMRVKLKAVELEIERESVLIDKYIARARVVTADLREQEARNEELMNAIFEDPEMADMRSELNPVYIIQTDDWVEVGGKKIDDLYRQKSELKRELSKKYPDILVNTVKRKTLDTIFSVSKDYRIDLDNISNSDLEKLCKLDTLKHAPGVQKAACEYFEYGFIDEMNYKYKQWLESSDCFKLYRKPMRVEFIKVPTIRGRETSVDDVIRDLSLLPGLVSHTKLDNHAYRVKTNGEIQLRSTASDELFAKKLSEAFVKLGFLPEGYEGYCHVKESLKRGALEQGGSPRKKAKREESLKRGALEQGGSPRKRQRRKLFTPVEIY